MSAEYKGIERISVVTFNVRGLRNRTKRRALFRHIRIKYKQSIIVLQETHSTPSVELKWLSEWRGEMIFSHCSETGQAGVAMLFPVSYPHTTSKLFESNGRIICAQVENENGSDPVVIVGVYGPAADDQSEKCVFISDLRELLLRFDTSALLLAGDLNIKLSKFDTDNDTFRCTRASNKLHDLMSEFALVDTWRFKHPTVRRYTWRRSNPRQQSRIDYIFASSNLIENNVADVRIDTGILSDHSFVYIDIILSAERRGPGIWRYNNSLLNDESHVESVREEIRKALSDSGIYSGVANTGLKVEMLLISIRVITVKQK